MRVDGDEAMNATYATMFEPGLPAFVRYVVGFVARYAVICGGLYVFFHVFRGLWKYKIQRRDAKPAHVRHEIFWSMVNTLVTGSFLMLVYWMITNGHTRFYFDIGEHGWGWFLLSIPLGTLGFDTWFYWMHRGLHTRWLFKHAHSVHHKSVNPTVFSAFAHHPIETLAEDLYFLVLIMVIPMHPLAFGFMGFHAFMLAVLGHMGYEFFPRGWTTNKILGLHNTGTHHNMHHSHPTGNYGLYFNWWDQLMGTNHPEYHRYFDGIKQWQVTASTPAPRSTEQTTAA